MSRDPITILYEIAQLGIGGAERQLYELVRRIDQERYRPLVFTLSEGGLYAELLADAHIPLCTFARRNRVDFIPVWRIAALIRKQNVRILHTYGYYAGLYARIAAIGVRPDVVISSERAIHSPGSLLGNSIYSALDRCLAPLTTGYIANAYAVKEYAAATKKLPEEKIHVVYNGIDLNRFRTSTATASVDSLAALGIRPSAKLVGFVARLDPIKNHPMFLHAIPQIVAAVPDAHFLIIGDGPMRSELEQLTHQLGLTDKVTFTGALKGDILIQFMASLEVSVLTSKREGCSNTVLEMMALGVPNVVTAAGGNPELVVDGQCGFVVPGGDSRALAAAINELLLDDQLRQKMGAAAKKRVAEGFTLDRMVHETTTLYEQLLA